MGCPDVDQMLRGMTAAQFEEWRLYDSLHPFGDARTEVEFARLQSFLAMLVSEKGKEIEVGDFMWSFKVAKRTREQKVADKIKAMFGIGNG